MLRSYRQAAPGGLLGGELVPVAHDWLLEHGYPADLADYERDDPGPRLWTVESILR